MIKVKWLEQTADTGCPSMWEGETDDRRMIYIRWRWDVLRAVVGKNSYEYYQKNDVNILDECDVIYMGSYYATINWLTTERMEEELKDYFIF